MADPYDLSQAGGKPAPSGAEPKLVVDSDWKKQAQAEKERLAAEEQKREAEAAASGRAGGAGAMPPADFLTLVGSLATQALLYTGGIADPETGRAVVALDYARHYIDLLNVLEQKTKGNLTPEEEAELTGILNELRDRYVYVSRGVAAAMAQQQATGGAPTGVGIPGAAGMSAAAGSASAPRPRMA